MTKKEISKLLEQALNHASNLKGNDEEIEFGTNLTMEMAKIKVLGAISEELAHIREEMIELRTAIRYK